jgi:hypothetical protein
MEVRQGEACGNRTHSRHRPLFGVQQDHHCNSAAHPNERPWHARCHASNQVDKYQRKDANDQGWKMSLPDLRNKIGNPQEEPGVGAHVESKQLTELTADDDQPHTVEEPDQDWTR